MSYRVRFEGAALVQLNGLPSAAFDALLQRAVDLAEETWDATLMPPGKDPAYRMGGHAGQLAGPRPGRAG